LTPPGRARLGAEADVGRRTARWVQPSLPRSWNSAKLTWLDREAVLSELRRAVRAPAEGIQPDLSG